MRSRFLVARLPKSGLTGNVGREEYTSIAGSELYSHWEKPLGGFRFLIFVMKGVLRV